MLRLCTPPKQAGAQAGVRRAGHTERAGSRRLGQSQAGRRTDRAETDGQHAEEGLRLRATPAGRALSGNVLARLLQSFSQQASPL